PLGNPSRGFSYNVIYSAYNDTIGSQYMLKQRFPNALLKCGAHDSKLALSVKPFSYDFELNAAFLGKGVRNG
ncbi:hypothetical protein, partial [Vibrio anguillarum]